MAEYIDIDQPLIFKDIRNRDVTGTIRTILKANHTELVLADVAPVRHGRWINHGWSTVCSECGEDDAFAKRNYCPNCGAKMDGDEP